MGESPFQREIARIIDTYRTNHSKLNFVLESFYHENTQLRLKKGTDEDLKSILVALLQRRPDERMDFPTFIKKCESL
jgi:hypothetical protein